MNIDAGTTSLWRDVDAVLIFNGSNHYSYAGKWSFVLVTGCL